MKTSQMMISNPVTNADGRRESKKKRKENAILNVSGDQQNQHQSKDRWKSEAEQQVYSTKLVEALRNVQLSPPANGGPKGGRAVREAADQVLAVAAKGRTRWSRAILTSRPLKLKFMKHNKQKATVSQTNRPKKPTVSVLRLKKSLPAVQRKVRFLGRIVPGCGKQPLPVILEETTDYIAALQMQIRAMTALTQLLSGTGTSIMPAHIDTHKVELMTRPELV